MGRMFDEHAYVHYYGRMKLLTRRNTTIVASVAAVGVLIHGVKSCGGEESGPASFPPAASQGGGEGCPPTDPPSIADKYAFDCNGRVVTVRDDGPDYMMARYGDEWWSVPRDQTHVLDLGGVTVRFAAVEPPVLEILQP